MLGTILIFLLILAAFCLILGFKSAAARIFWSVVFVIIGMVILNALLGNLNSISIGSGLSKLFTIIFLVLIGIALLRFITHRRKLEKWRGEKPISLKRRVERE